MMMKHISLFNEKQKKYLFTGHVYFSEYFIVTFTSHIFFKLKGTCVSSTLIVRNRY
jgi:hypothetical protein